MNRNWLKGVICSIVVVCVLVTSDPGEVSGSNFTRVGESGTGVLTDDAGNTRENYSEYDPNATIKYETNTFFYIAGLDESLDVSLEEIAEATGKNFNSADTISGFKYNNPAATDSVEIDDIIDTLVYLGHGREVKNLYGSGTGQLYASSYNTIRAYDARTGDADTAKTYGKYEVSLRNPENTETEKALDAFLTDISWGDTEVVRKTALYRIDGVTEYMPVLTPTRALFTATPIPTHSPDSTRPAPTATTAVHSPYPTYPLYVTATSIPSPVPKAGIIYNGNGADGGSTWNSIVSYGGTFTVSSNGYYKQGYHDKGRWNTERDGSGKWYEPGDKVTVYASDGGDRFLVLYAIWDSDEFIVEYDYNADFLAFPDELKKGVTGEGLTGGRTVKVYSDPYSYTTYLLGEDCAVIRSGDCYVLPEPSARGYSFINWSLREMDSGNGYWGNYVLPGDICSTPENHTLYAVWLAETYKVTFDCCCPDDETENGVEKQDGEPVMKAMEVEFGAPYGQLPEPMRLGYEFKGWRKEKKNGNGSGDIVTADTICDTDGDHELYAAWEAVKIRLSFDGTEAQYEPVLVTYGLKIGNVFPEPEKRGYTFIGWNTDINGEGEYIDKNTVSHFYTDTHVYAIFEAKEHTVTLDYDWEQKRDAVNAKIDGEAVDTNRRKTDRIAVVFGENYPALSVPEREGYVFCGWYMQGSEGDSRITEDSLVQTIEDEVLYAKWSSILIRVIYDSNNEGDSDPDNDIEDTKYTSRFDPMLVVY